MWLLIPNILGWLTQALLREEMPRRAALLVAVVLEVALDCIELPGTSEGASREGQAHERTKTES